MSYKNKQVYSVLVPLNIKNNNCEFDYLSKEKLKVGTAVKVSVGNKNIVWGIIKNKKDFDIKIKYKSIISTNQNIILNSQLLFFIFFIKSIPSRPISSNLPTKGEINVAPDLAAKTA